MSTENITIESLKENNAVYFSASWCAPCKVTKPIVEKVQSEREETIQIIVIDEIDESLLDEIRTEFGVRSVPTTIFFKDSEEVDRKVGGYNEVELISLLETNA